MWIQSLNRESVCDLPFLCRTRLRSDSNDFWFTCKRVQQLPISFGHFPGSLSFLSPHNVFPLPLVEMKKESVWRKEERKVAWKIIRKCNVGHIFNRNPKIRWWIYNWWAFNVGGAHLIIRNSFIFIWDFLYIFHHSFSLGIFMGLWPGISLSYFHQFIWAAMGVGENENEREVPGPGRNLFSISLGSQDFIGFPFLSNEIILWAKPMVKEVYFFLPLRFVVVLGRLKPRGFSLPNMGSLRQTFSFAVIWMLVGESQGFRPSNTSPRQFSFLLCFLGSVFSFLFRIKKNNTAKQRKENGEDVNGLHHSFGSDGSKSLLYWM